MKKFVCLRTYNKFAKALIHLCCITAIAMIAPVLAQDSSTYRVYWFISNFHRYQIGDVAPDLYFTPEYHIDKWKIRHLPAPSTGAHWSFMYGTYVLLNESSHKIILAYNSDIFYKSEP